jgi:SAM-dependent methyltransferase
MVCHGELARRRPAPAYLTSFYLMVSLGGAVGGLLVGFAAPYLLNAVYDLQVIVTLTALLFLYLLWKERGNMEMPPMLANGIRLVVVIGCIAPVVILGIKHDYSAPLLYGLAGLVAATLLAGQMSAAWSMRFALAAGLTCAMGTYLAKDVVYIVSGSRVLMRNFYGSLQVFDEDTDGKQGKVRVLRHGTIDHGEQFLRPENSRRPTTYFTAGSGIGQAVLNLQKAGAMKVGIIGLGAGSIAAYCRAGDNYRYYDINPQVVDVAEKEFTYLSGCPATHDVLLGDARLVIEGLPLQNYDLLVVDAFSGDAIPVHLLTREAWQLYWRHLKPDGVLAVHVSNRYLRLAPVVDLGAQANQKQAKIVSYDGGDIDEEAASDWVLVSSRPGFFESLDKNAGKIEPIPGLRPWTDDYSNVFKILR